jgi:hypothetical protein
MSGLLARHLAANSMPRQKGNAPEEASHSGTLSYLCSDQKSLTPSIGLDFAISSTYALAIADEIRRCLRTAMALAPQRESDTTVKAL